MTYAELAQQGPDLTFAVGIAVVAVGWLAFWAYCATRLEHRNND